MGGKHTPWPLIVSKAAEMAERQFQIESDWINSDGEWRDKYVCFSGFFGSHGPHVFAAAPEMLDALKAFLAYDEQDGESDVEMMLAYGNARDMARAALLKAEGQS